MYLHKRKSDNQIFYVGIGSSKKRPYDFQKRNPFWKLYVEKYGRPDVHIVMEDLPHHEAKEVEMLLIAMIGRRKDGGTLVNITRGGDDQPMWDPESVEKVRAAMKGRKFRQETLTRMSAAKKGGKQPEGTFRNLLERIGNGWNPMATNEARAKVSAFLKGRPKSAEHARKNGEVHSKPVMQFDREGNLIARFDNARRAAEAMGCTYALIGMACNGRVATAKGYVWKFEREAEKTVALFSTS